MPDEKNTDSENHNHPNSLTGSLTGTELRASKRAQRKQLSTEMQKHHSEKLFKLTIKQKIYQNSQHIAVYLANDGEINPVRIIEHAWSSGKKVYLPVLSPVKNSLFFAPYEDSEPLKLNRFNIPEPICPPDQYIKASELDLLLLPLVAFDAQGNRLGMGGGFYDRTLEFLQHQIKREKPKLAGLAHECQKVNRLNIQSWDIPLDHIITEEQVYDVVSTQRV